MLSQDDCLLVVVDIQGKLARLVQESAAFIERSHRLIQASRMLEIPVLLSQQCPDKLGPTVPELQASLHAIQPIDKASFSCWPHPTFRARIMESGRSNIILCGIEAHICVYQTASDLLRQGYKVHVIFDAVSSRTHSDKQVALELLVQMGARVVTLELLLFEILGTAEHPAFRQVSNLVK